MLGKAVAKKHEAADVQIKTDNIMGLLKDKIGNLH